MLHKNIIPSERHKIFSWEVADATALGALTPIAADVGKVALQLSPFDVLVLEDEDDGLGNPVWVSMLAPALIASSISVVDANGYYTDTDLEGILDEIGQSLDALNTALILAENANVWAIAYSDETTNITAGTSKASFHAPFDGTIQEIFAGLTTAQASGSIYTVDVNKNGASILSTKLTIDNTELTSLTAATAPVLSSNTVVKGDLISVDVDQIGTAGARGGKIYMRMRRTS